MANVLYSKAKETFLSPWYTGVSIDLINDRISAALLSTSIFVGTNQFYLEVVGAQVGPTVELTNKSVVNGLFSCENLITFPSVSGATIQSIVIFKDTNDAFTSPLIAYIDIVQSGLPLTPSGKDIIVEWAPNGIFKL